ncbi:hypothetical protein QWZ16_22210 [Vibrio ostreicida]|uniref:Uncharacterized protein n=1 Tax=Vibrio ostreicida TaxID=526588 RepID=A0ABT8C0X5_9VIBR|nr:hypothetical protein [Vibrio ostreicida]MDN3612314.1 hypothetical protein [Vibrio ostreicida]
MVHHLIQEENVAAKAWLTYRGRHSRGGQLYEVRNGFHYKRQFSRLFRTL